MISISEQALAVRGELSNDPVSRIQLMLVCMEVSLSKRPMLITVPRTLLLGTVPGTTFTKNRAYLSIKT